MRFEAAWMLLLILPLLAYLAWLSRKSYAQLRPAAAWTSLLLRALALTLLLGAISRPDLLQHSRRDHVVFLIDVSKSITTANVDAAIDEVTRLAKTAVAAHGGVRASLVAFGRRPELLIDSGQNLDSLAEDVRDKIRYQAILPELYAQRTKLISAAQSPEDEAVKKLNTRIATIESFRDHVAGDFTDVERAVRLALNCGDTASRRTLYLLTDANFNRGRWQDAFANADAAGAKIHTVILDKTAPAEVALAGLATPPTARVDESFTAEVRIASTVETPATLRIFKDGYAQPDVKTTLKAGETLVKLPALYFHDKGFHNIEVTVHADQDTQVENNRIRSLVIVPGEARVLYIDRDLEQASYLKSALELEGIQVEVRSPAGVPQTLAELLSFDAFILCNVPSDKLAARQMQMVKTYVQDFGGGFIMLGGDESFGLGGYYNTPIEEILPVRMPIQKDVTRPSLALMLVIDKSGSMEGVKIEIAKRAAIATAEAINPRDLIGVVGFDSESRVLLELTPAADRGSIASHVAELEAGGGTFLYPGLTDAQNRLSQSNARRKHIIVMSDGQTQGFGYEDFVSSMAADGITLSTIGIGNDADMKLMEGIASAGGGRAYFTNEFQTIPQIFTREALRASKSMLVERLVQPHAIGRDPALEEIDVDELPALTGYVATTPRAAASMLIVSDSGDPILAKWRCGLGRTAAFTSEAKPRWAEDWVEWSDFAKFWSQLVRSVTGQDLSHTMHIACGHYLSDAGAILTADVSDAGGEFPQNTRMEVTSVSNDGASHALPVRVTGPGLFEATLPDFKFGENQQLIWRIEKDIAATTSAPGTNGTDHGATDHAGTNGTTGSTTAPSAAPAAATPTAAEPDQSAPYGFVYPFSPEYSSLGPSAETLEQIKTRAGGDVVSVGHADLALSGSSAARWTPLWPFLLIAALLIVPVDILVRRLG